MASQQALFTDFMQTKVDDLKQVASPHHHHVRALIFAAQMALAAGTDAAAVEAITSRKYTKTR